MIIAAQLRIGFIQKTSYGVIFSLLLYAFLVTGCDSASTEAEHDAGIPDASEDSQVFDASDDVKDGEDHVDTIDDGGNEELIPFEPLTGASDQVVFLHHLKYRQESSVLSPWVANRAYPGYEYFLNEHNPDDWEESETEHIFLGEIWAPPPHEVEFVVLLSAGQQGALLDRQDYTAIITGQTDNWHDNPSHTGTNLLEGWQTIITKDATITGLSLAGQFIADAEVNNSDFFGMTPQNTYMAVLFDACFYYELSIEKKQELLSNYLEWLMSRADYNSAQRMKAIYLAGASRGGALVSRMGIELTHNPRWKALLSGVQVIVSAFDGVANEEQGELFATTTQVQNPLDNSKFCYATTLPDEVDSTVPLHLLQIAGGAPVVPVVAPKRAFYFETVPDLLEFRWVNLSHSEIGRVWHDETAAAHLRWLQRWLME